MKFIFSTLFIALMAMNIGFTQHIYFRTSSIPGIDSNFYMDDVFENIDTSSLISTGLLWDKVFPNTNFLEYSGDAMNETPITPDKLLQAYIDLKFSEIGSPILEPYDSLLEYIHEYSKASTNIPLIVLNFKMNRIKDDAFSENLLEYNNGKFSIPIGMDPFEEITTFMVGIPFTEIESQEGLSFVLSKSFFLSNLEDTVTSVRIQYENDSKWYTLNWGVPFEMPTGSNELRFTLEVTCSDNTVLYSHAGFSLAPPCNNFPLPEEAPWGGEEVTFWIRERDGRTGTMYPPVEDIRYINHFLTASESYLNKKATGKVYVRYRPNAPFNEPKNFGKPIIIVEGLDLAATTYSRIISSTTNNFSNTIRLGEFGWPELWGCSGDKYPNAKMPQMMSELYDNGYDVILLDFEDGADYMQRNGLLLKELINRVNQHKIGNEELVVMGVSMGGQIVRWTLTHMEANNEDHCSRLFVSHDSPWKGAVLPPSIMYTFTYLAEAKGHKKALDALRNLNRPAPKQLLLHHLSYDGINPVYATVNGDYHRYFTYNGSASTVLREQFIQEVMQNGNYPKFTRNVAITNGNISGIQKYGNGVGLFEMNSSCFGATIQFGLFSKNRSDHLVTNIKEPKYRRRQWYVSGLPNMSGSPGGSRNDLFKTFRDGVEAELPGLCGGVTVPTAYQQPHTFIPTLSGLGINNQNWMLNVGQYINPNAPALSNLTHFDAIDGPSTEDELHGRITDDNLVWLMRQITLGENKLTNATGGVLTSVWNNPTENQFLGSLDIQSNGVLKLNANGPIYDFTGTADPHTIAGSLSRVSIGLACSPGIVAVEDGGKLVLGDMNSSTPTQNNKSYLEIGNGSALNLHQGSEAEILGYSKILVKPGGILRIYNGAELICHENTIVEIEEGGILEFHQGAIINLLSSNSYLLLKGTLDIKNNAIFDISGNGFIKWEKGNSNPVITAGTNAKLQLEGSSLSHKLMELSNNTVLDFPASLEFEIKNGKVFCSPGSGINISGKSTLFNSWFAGTGGATQPFNGVTVSSTQLNDIRFNYFDYANTGLNLIQTGNPNMPTLTGNRYRWCVTGLRVHDKGAIINGSHFIENGRGIELSATSARVNITGSNFQENTFGVLIVGTNPSPIQIVSSTFNWSGTHSDEIAISCESGNLEVRGNNIDGYRYGVMGSGYLRLACNTITGAEIAIEALPGATLNMANEARNNISNNGTGIGLYEAWLKIHNGKNKLDENTDRSIWGYIREDIYAKETLTHKTGAFDYYKYTFSNNLLNDPVMFPATTTGTSTGFLINYWPDVTTCYQEYLLDPNNPGQAIVSFSDNSSYNEPLFFECNPCNFDYQTCGEASPPWYTELYAELSVATNPTSLIISTPRFLNIELKDAIRQAMGHLTFEYNDPQHDLLALAELKDILTYNYGSDKENIEELLGYVRHAMTQGLANAYTNGLLPVEYGVNPLPLSDYAEAILNELDALIDQDPGNFNQIGYYSIEKAQVYRLAGHYQLALDELNTTNASYAPNRDYWLCICTQEWDFLQGNIDIDQFIENTSQCDGLFQARKRRMRSTAREGIYQKPNLTQLVLIPNPTDGPFKVSVPISTEKAQIEIYTPQGSIVKIMEVPASTSSVMVENLHLLPGTYLVKYKGAEKQLNGKLVVIK